MRGKTSQINDLKPQKTCILTDICHAIELSNDARKCRIGSLFHYFRLFKPLTFAERWTTLDSNEDKMFMHRSHLLSIWCSLNFTVSTLWTPIYKQNLAFIRDPFSTLFLPSCTLQGVPTSFGPYLRSFEMAIQNLLGHPVLCVFQSLED